MATSLTTTYAGEFKDKYISAGLISGKTLDNGGVTIYGNVAYKEVIQKVATGSDFIVDATCDYTDAGTLTLTERVLQVEEFQINKTECKKTFAQAWQSAQMGYSVPNEILPKSFADYIVQHYIAKISAHVERVIWQGTNATSGEVDGFTTIFNANASDLAGGAVITGTTISSSNVIDEMAKVVDNISANTPALLDDPDLKIYVSNNIFQKYLRALGGFQANGVGGSGVDAKGSTWYDGSASLTFDGIPVFNAPGLPANDMVGATSSNLFFGMGVQGDLSDLRLIDTADTLGDQNVRFVARFKMGVQVGLLEEISYYS